MNFASFFGLIRSMYSALPFAIHLLLLFVTFCIVVCALINVLQR